MANLEHPPALSTTFCPGCSILIHNRERVILAHDIIMHAQARCVMEYVSITGNIVAQCPSVPYLEAAGVVKHGTFS
jgi:hypothetical protein